LLSAYDGGEGFRLAVEHVPDLLISDIDMPVMNGYEMCQRIKETESTRGIPILILSARGAGVDIDRGFDAGANDFLTKPVADNELLSRIEMMLDSTLTSQREKILVVEESSVQRALITKSLAQQGFEIISGKDGEEGLELAIENVPDLVITDSEMPLMNGRDLTRALRQRDELKIYRY
jgi:putative two-component system response regulator